MCFLFAIMAVGKEDHPCHATPSYVFSASRICISMNHEVAVWGHAMLSRPFKTRETTPVPRICDGT